MNSPHPNTSILLVFTLPSFRAWLLMLIFAPVLTLPKFCWCLGSILLQCYLILFSSLPWGIDQHVMIWFSWHPTYFSLFFISWFTASRQKMNGLHFVLLNQNGMEKTGLIIFYSNPTYLYHLLLSPVKSDMSAISCLCCLLTALPQVLLIHDLDISLLQSWVRSARSSSPPVLVAWTTFSQE